MTKPIKKKRVLKKEPQTIFEQEYELMNKAKKLSKDNDIIESKKLCDGYTWVQVDNRTRKLIKK